MIAWRISSADRASAALSGEGAFRYPGRWNLVGTPMVYCSTASALAVLEYVTHVPRNIRRPVDLVLLKIAMPDNRLEVLADGELPVDWDVVPPSASTQSLGTDWANRRGSLGLVVPTAILPLSADQKNLLINPLHPHVADVRIVEHIPFDLTNGFWMARYSA